MLTGGVIAVGLSSVAGVKSGLLELSWWFAILAGVILTGALWWLVVRLMAIATFHRPVRALREVKARDPGLIRNIAAVLRRLGWRRVGVFLAWGSSGLLLFIVGLLIDLGSSARVEPSPASDPTEASRLSGATCGPLARVDQYRPDETTVPVHLDTAISARLVDVNGHGTDPEFRSTVQIDPRQREVLQFSVFVQNAEARPSHVARNFSLSLTIPRQLAPDMSVLASVQADNAVGATPGFPDYHLADVVRLESREQSFFLSDVRSVAYQLNYGSREGRPVWGAPVYFPSCAVESYSSPAVYRLTLPAHNPDGSLSARREAPEALRYLMLANVRPSS